MFLDLRTCVNLSGNFSLRFTLFPSISVDSGAILRLTLTETDTNITLEFDGIPVGEFESIKNGGQMTGHGIVIPIPENVGICGTAIFIRYSVNSLVVVVVYGSGDAVSSKSTIDFSW